MVIALNMYGINTTSNYTYLGAYELAWIYMKPKHFDYRDTVAYSWGGIQRKQVCVQYN